MRLHTDQQQGFTLIEMMVAILVAAILVTIAVPSYTAQIRKAHRTDARSALLDAAQREERYLSTMSAYTNVAGSLGYASLPASINNVYTMQVCVNNGSPCALPSSASGTYFQISATASSPQQQQDTQCYTLLVDSNGTQTSQDSSGNPTTGCWQ